MLLINESISVNYKKYFFLFCLFLLLIPTSAIAATQTIILVSGQDTQSAGYTSVIPTQPLDALSYSWKGWSAAIPTDNSLYIDSDSAPFGSGAIWISSAASNEGSFGDQWRLFEADFTVPDGSTIRSAQISYTADNAVTVYLNDIEIGSTGYVFGSPPVHTPDYSSSTWFFQKSYVKNFNPKIGINNLKFVVRNWANTQYNPTGLLYKAIIRYEAQSPTLLPSTIQTQILTPIQQKDIPSENPLIQYAIILLAIIVTVIAFSYLILKNRALQKTIIPPTDTKKQRRDSDNIGSSNRSLTGAQPPAVLTLTPLTPKQLPPDLSDRYTESEFIGKGGFARVFKVKRKDGKYVAVKIPISMDAVTGKSFIAEMQNWTKLSHPNIVRLYDFNIMPMPYFEEELCDSALADQNKPIESEEAAWILFNICEGLKFAHSQKIIHRDLKPQNILLKNGVPKISDWGLSRIISESTTTTATSFTPSYAAPEQIGNKVKDERTDIWQLGVILYELVTGVLPFQGDSMIEIGMNIATKDPIPPGEIKPDAKVIDAVVMKCLQKDPAKRYPSALELQKDLAMYLRQNYTELLKTSLSVQDSARSAYYCGDLIMINLLTGDIPTAYKYLLDLVHYSKGEVKVEAQELSEQIKMRMEMGVTEIPDELIQKAEIIVHQVSVGFRK